MPGFDYPDARYTEADVRAKLGKLPRGSGERYEAIIDKISSHVDGGNRLDMTALCWTVSAHTSFSMDEVSVTVSVDDHGNMGDLPNLETDSILRFCHSLVVWDSHQEVFRFGHLSVRGFVEISTQLADSNTIFADACLDVFCSPNKQTGQNRESISINRYWPIHIRSCSLEVEKHSSTIGFFPEIPTSQRSVHQMDYTTLTISRV